jgi:hypothetical protein
MRFPESNMKRIVNRFSRTSATAALACWLVVACGKWTGSNDRYRMQSSSDGRIYRMDRATGDVFVIDDGILRPVDATCVDSELGKPRTWERQSLPGGSSAEITTKWECGRLLYRMVVSSSPQLDRPIGTMFHKTLRVTLNDKDGFSLLRADLDVERDAIRSEGLPSWAVLSEKDLAALATPSAAADGYYLLSGSLTCGRETCRRLQSVRIGGAY